MCGHLLHAAYREHNLLVNIHEEHDSEQANTEHGFMGRKAQSGTLAVVIAGNAERLQALTQAQYRQLALVRFHDPHQSRDCLTCVTSHSGPAIAVTVTGRHTRRPSFLSPHV